MRRLQMTAVLVVAFAALAAASDTKLAPGEVRLPLAEYHTLIQEVEAANAARARPAPTPVPRLGEVVSQLMRLVVDDDLVIVENEFVLEAAGSPPPAIELPVTGLAQTVHVEPQSVAVGHDGDGLRVYPLASGRYRVHVQGTAPLVRRETDRTVRLAPAVAAMAEVVAELPADDDWSCDGAVVASEEVVDGRRTVRLAPDRGAEHTLVLTRRAAMPDEPVSAQTVLVTLVEIGRDHLRRFDVVAYEVARGDVRLHTLELPAGLTVDGVHTDEGPAPLHQDGRELRVQRASRMTGNGFVVVASRSAGDVVSLAPVRPAIAPRVRYLAVASEVPAEFEPAPAAAWTRVDLSDLPSLVLSAAEALDLTAAWRLSDDTDAPTLEVSRLPLAEPIEAVIRRRDTTTLLTVEGTLLHRELITVAQAGSSLPLKLTADGVLWSAKIDGLGVRPVERDGRTLIPLPFAAGGDTVVELVAVSERAVPEIGSEVVIRAPEIPVPVLEHRWRVLMPEGPSYRVERSDLRQQDPPRADMPTQTVHVTAEDDWSNTRAGAVRGLATYDEEPLPGVTVTLNSPALQGTKTAITTLDGRFYLPGLPPASCELRFMLDGFQTAEASVTVRAGRTYFVDMPMQPLSLNEEIIVTGRYDTVDSVPAARAAAEEKQRLDSLREASQEMAFVQEARDLRKGLVGGVRPVPVTVPESGTLLYLVGALPPPAVTVELKVKR